MHASFWLLSLPYYTDLSMSCSMSSISLLMSASAVAHMPVQLLVRTYLGNLIYPGMTAFPFCLWCWYVCKHLSFSWVWAHTLSSNYLLKERNASKPRWTFSLLSFRFTCMHTHSSFFNISSWLLPCSSKSAIKITSTIPNLFNVQLNSLYVFF